MKHSTLIASALIALTSSAAAQWPGDDFDSYTNGQVLDNVGGWKGWDNVSASAASVSNAQSRSAPHSLLIGGTTDAVRPLIGATSGKWTLTAWQYIPTGGLASGQVFVILNNIYNDGGPYSFTVELQCDGVTNTVIDDLHPHTPQPIVYDQWVEYRFDINLDTDTMSTYYNGALVSSGGYTEFEGGPLAIDNLDLFSLGGTCYMDDISLDPVPVADNEFEIMAGDNGVGVNAISRGNFGTGEGSMFQGYPPSHFAGIGDDGTTCELTGFQFIIQDQDTATADPFVWAIRSGSAAGPDLGAGGLLAGFNLSVPTSTGGPGAWLLTFNLTTPVSIPCDDHFFVGYQFDADPDWPAIDGLAPQLRVLSADGTFLVGQPHHAWQFIGDPDTGTVIQPSARVLAIALRTPCPTLNVGSLGVPALSPDFGGTGMYTNVALPNSLGLTFRVRDAANPNGNALILFGTSYGPAFGLGGFGIKGNLWLTNGLIGQLFSTTLNANGESISSPAWMGAGELHRFGGSNATVLFQALTFSPPVLNVRASNGAGTRLF